MTNKFDLNNFNSFLDKANQAISCGQECQKQKTEQQLKDNYLNAQKNLTLAEPEYQMARKNYYVYVSGEGEYNEMMREEYRQKADLIVEKFKENFQEDVAKIKSELETYNGTLINFRNIVDLHRQYKEENIRLFKKLKTDTNDILTNERKTFYEDQQNETLNSYYVYILWVIYTIVVICLIIFSLFFPSQTNWKIRLGLVILFIILPFISTWVLGKIIYIVYWLFGLLPKNVYK